MQLRAEHVSKAFGPVAAVTDVTLTIGHGITGLLGPNGAGKTTFLSLVLGLQRPDAGELQVLGLRPEEAGPHIRARLGYGPEHDAFPPDVGAEDFVRHLARLHGLPPRDAAGRAAEALRWTGLGEEVRRPLGTLSTGQRQRVMLAQAVVHDPELVLLDEPTSGLDPLQRDEMLDLIRRVGTDLGRDVVLSSHLLHEVERVADGVVILDEGRVVAEHRLDGGHAEHDELLLEVEGPVDALVPHLREAGLRVTGEGSSRLLVTAADDTAVDAVRDALADCGVGIRRLERVPVGLQELYAEAAG
ncbi:ABC transporter ATP-binding protein [Egibacter rhizosphaerae]|uniref:ABC transporter ATP-binding protein n=1 Tax=Egibacter rhizosphaerae TaxID=1670831 RepID=A0A411YJF8_9ACTN|nr:ABC transporter ATP-binding protein [Egibacter rhizosphaerae]QBI21353.1 ABC transporter ATP-binding protein [Egibacter rhizosphaerae]